MFDVMSEGDTLTHVLYVFCLGRTRSSGTPHSGIDGAERGLGRHAGDAQDRIDGIACRE